MKTLLKLCRVIIHKNKGITVGIFLMSILSFIVAIIGVNFGTSSNDTMNNFLSTSNSPQVIYTTQMMSNEIKGQLSEIEGVSYVSDGVVLDVKIATNNGSLFSVRLFSWDEGAPYKQTYHENAEEELSGIRVSVSYKFAEYNGIHPQDGIKIIAPFGSFNAVIQSTVANPETMTCVKDEMSIYEDNQFAYIYMDKEELDALLPFTETVNRWLIYFDGLIDESAERVCMANIRNLLGGDLISELYVKESEAITVLKDDLNTISILSSFIPGLVWLISLGFGFIFIKIIIENQKQTIGLLRALGFSNKKIIYLFVFYTAIINVLALLIGVATGYGLLSLCVKIIASTSGIVEYVVSIRYVATVLSFVAVFIIGALSALLSARAITKIAPSEAYGETFNTNTEPPKILKKIKANAFLKISLGATFRKTKRQIIGALCITACIISICVGLEGVLTIGYPINAVYGGRYHYDLMVRDIDGASYSEIQSSITDIERIEPFIYFSSDLNGEKVRVSTLPVDAELTTLYDASNDNLKPSDGIIIDEMRAKINGFKVGDTVNLDGLSLPITGIAREILYTVLYVNEDTALKMGHSDVNGAMITLKDGVNVKDVEERISEISPTAYFTSFTSQKENIKNGFIAMRTVMAIFAVIAFLIGSLLIINLTLIDFNEGKRKFATLRALGTPVQRISEVSLIQNLFRVLLGIIFALPLTYFSVYFLLELISTPSQQYVMVRFTGCLITSCCIPLLYVLIGTAVSMIKIKKFNFCAYLNKVG